MAERMNDDQRRVLNELKAQLEGLLAKIPQSVAQGSYNHVQAWREARKLAAKSKSIADHTASISNMERFFK